MTKGGLVSDFSPWRGRWGVYWRIKQWWPAALREHAIELAETYPQTWELRLVLRRQKHNEQENQ